MKNIALLGCAHIHTPGFVRRLQDRRDVRVTAVWDHDSARMQATAAQLQAPACRHLPKLLADPSLDAVIICSETHRHRRLALAAAGAGKHLYIEKPLGLNGRDAAAIASAIQAAGVLFQTGYFMRGNPAHLWLKQNIAAGTFGRITRIRHKNCHHGALDGWFDRDWRWMADRRMAGCGGFGDLGTHSLDILLWLLGMPEKVTAHLQNISGRYGTDTDEAGEALLLFPDGCLASLAASWLELGNPLTCEVSGTAAYAYVLNQEVYCKKAGETTFVKQNDLPEARPHAFCQFLDALTGKPAELVSATEAAQRNLVMDALYLAARRQRWITLPANPQPGML